jgi:hypothetical protein
LTGPNGSCATWPKECVATGSGTSGHGLEMHSRGSIRLQKAMLPSQRVVGGKRAMAAIAITIGEELLEGPRRLPGS